MNLGSTQSIRSGLLIETEVCPYYVKFGFKTFFGIILAV